MAMFCYHINESAEMTDEIDEERESDGPRSRVFGTNRPGPALPIGQPIRPPGQEPQSRLDRYLSTPPQSNFVYNTQFSWYNDPRSKPCHLTQSNRSFSSCPTNEYVARNVERVFSLRNGRESREALAVPDAQYYRIKRREMHTRMHPKKRKKLREIVKRIRAETQMEKATDLRSYDEIARYRFHHQMKLPLLKAANCPPISEQEYYFTRAKPFPNQLRVVEAQVCPSLDKAHHTDKIIEPKSCAPMTYIISQFMEKNDTLYCENIPDWPEEFDNEGYQQRYLDSCETILYKQDRLFAPDLDRFINEEEVIGDEISMQNFMQLPISPLPTTKFRCSNLQAEAFSVTGRAGAKSSVCAKTSICHFWPVSSGFTCVSRHTSGLPSSPEGICKVCKLLIEEVYDSDDPIFTQNQVFEYKKNLSDDAIFGELTPRELLSTQQSLKRAEAEYCIFKDEHNGAEYARRMEEAKLRYESCQKAFRATQAERRRMRQNEVKCDYVRSRFGDDQNIKRFLFHLSSVCLNPSNLREITCAVDNSSGNVHFAISSIDAITGEESYCWFENIYVDVFQNFDEDHPFHAFFSFRGRHNSMECIYLGGMPVYPTTLWGNADANFQSATRKKEQQKFARVISLKAMVRFQILKIRQNSLCEKVALVTHSMNTEEYTKSVYFHAISRACAHLQMLILKGEYATAEQIDNVPSLRVFVHTQDGDPDPEFAQSMLLNSIQPKASNEEHSLPIETENDQVAPKNSNSEPSAASFISSPPVHSAHRAKLANDDQKPSSSIIKSQDVKPKQHTRKQKITVRTFPESASSEAENEMLLGFLHEYDINPERPKPLIGFNRGFWKMIHATPTAIKFPNLVVQNGSFQDFCALWEKTKEMNFSEMTFFRRDLTKHFRPTIRTDTVLDPSLFRFCSYSLYDF